LNALKRDGKKIAAAIIITRGTTAESIFFTDTMTRNALIRRFDALLPYKKPRSRALRTFTKHNQTQNQELARDRPGESRRRFRARRNSAGCPGAGSLVADHMCIYENQKFEWRCQ
jgi:hypothetical protein